MGIVEVYPVGKPEADTSQVRAFSARSARLVSLPSSRQMVVAAKKPRGLFLRRVLLQRNACPQIEPRGPRLDCGDASLRRS